MICNCFYLLTVVDHFTCFPASLTIQNITATSVAQSLVNHWISFFGVLAMILTYRGTQFESVLFKEITGLLGTWRWQTAAYHPQADEMVERLHCTPKTSLMAQPNPHNWACYLPLILLSIRIIIKEDLGCAPDELIFGTTLRLPEDFVCHNCLSSPTPGEVFTFQLKIVLSRITATPPR